MAKQPIATAPKDGTVIFIEAGGTVARAKWAGTGLWAYDLHDPDHIEQVDFEPKHWSDNPRDLV